jgi:glycosyltransferase involved in cell wall biosynthesis
MSKQPTISVIIPNFNNAKFLTECINSVFTQTYQPIECIVVDDGSTDNSVELLGELSQSFPRLRILEQINAGPSVARNLGMKHANGEYIAMLDADDYWSETKLENQVKIINKIGINKHIITSHVKYYRQDGSIFITDNIKKPPYTIFDAFAKNVAIGSCSSVLFPKKIINEIGGYNAMLRVSEDQDFHFRAIVAGYQFYHSNNTDVHIRWHEGNTTKNAIKNIYFNLLAFEIQREHLHQLKLITTNKKHFFLAVNGKMGNIYYWADVIKRKDIKSYINALKRKEFGLKFYYKHIIISFFYKQSLKVFNKTK